MMQSRIIVTKARIVVDTDVCSYLFNGHTLAEFFRPYFLHKTLALSFVTVAQIYFGAYAAGWGPTRLKRLENHHKNYVVLPYSNDVCIRWAKTRAERKSAGLPNSESDMWIAACALTHDCALATNNTRHFTGIPNLELIAPGLPL